MIDLSADEVRNLYSTVKSLVAEMARLGGRDTEKNLFGRPGLQFRDQEGSLSRREHLYLSRLPAAARALRLENGEKGDSC